MIAMLFEILCVGAGANLRLFELGIALPQLIEIGLRLRRWIGGNWGNGGNGAERSERLIFLEAEIDFTIINIPLKLADNAANPLSIAGSILIARRNIESLALNLTVSFNRIRKDNLQATLRIFDPSYF